MTVHGLDFKIVGDTRTAAARDQRPGFGEMIDHGLDLAVIGNGRTAALVDPCSRIVWWCYPRFDGDPIFIGDDTTDEPVFAIIPKFGGLGFSVGRVVADANGHFDKPESVRAWLARIANQAQGNQAQGTAS